MKSAPVKVFLPYITGREGQPVITWPAWYLKRVVNHDGTISYDQIATTRTKFERSHVVFVCCDKKPLVEALKEMHKPNLFQRFLNYILSIINQLKWEKKRVVKGAIA